MEAKRAAAPAHLSEDIYTEILAWLPVKSVLRFRAVCKAWRDIITSPHFLAAHARRQPAKIVLYTYLDSVSDQCDIALDVLPVSGDTADQRRLIVIRYTRSDRFMCPLDPLLVDSCNGVLLFRNDAAGIYFLCNPATRQWAELPKLTDDQSYGGLRFVTEHAFYFHQKSGEYRLLCSRATSAGRAFCILYTGTAEPRQVDTHAADDDQLVPEYTLLSDTTLVALHDSTHWPSRRPPDSSSEQETTTTEMVAFDVQLEKFRLMAGPRTATCSMMKLFVMNRLLVAANFREKKKKHVHVHVDLWFLVDYGAERWERRHRFPTPWQSVWEVSSPNPSSLWSTAAACDDQAGNIMLGVHKCGLLVYNMTMKTDRIVDSVPSPTKNVFVSRHVFRESLVEHPNFKRMSSADLPFTHFWC